MLAAAAGVYENAFSSYVAASSLAVIGILEYAFSRYAAASSLVATCRDHPPSRRPPGSVAAELRQARPRLPPQPRLTSLFSR